MSTSRLLGLCLLAVGLGVIATTPKALAYGQKCDLLNACVKGEECFGGTCIKRCNADSECTRGQFDKCTLGECRIRACDADLDCGARMRCNVASGGTSTCSAVACNADRDCTTNVCIDYQCLACRADTGCSSRQCNEATHQCVTCRADTDCPSAFPLCQTGQCGQCNSDAQCGAKQVCSRERTCFDVQCKTAADCGAGMDCLANHCAFQKTDFQRLLAELGKIRTLVIQVPSGLGLPVGVSSGDLVTAINGSGAVHSQIGLLVLDKSGRTLVDLGRYSPAAGTTTLSLPGVISAQPSGAIPTTGDLCGFAVAVTDDRGAIQGRTSLCLAPR